MFVKCLPFKPQESQYSLPNAGSGPVPTPYTVLLFGNHDNRRGHPAPVPRDVSS